MYIYNISRILQQQLYHQINYNDILYKCVILIIVLYPDNFSLIYDNSSTNCMDHINFRLF